MIKQCPAIEIPFPKVFTSGGPLDFNAPPGSFISLRHHGVVHGSGATPEAAFDDLSKAAVQLAYRLVQDNWQMIVINDQQRTAQISRVAGISEAAAEITLRGNFVVVNSRLASGVLGNVPGWVAYGTLASHPMLGEVVVLT